MKKMIPNYPNYYATKSGDIFSRIGEEKVLKGSITKYGYKRVCLRFHGKKADHPVHRLILEAFIGRCPKGMQACHNNGDKLDNRLSNLRWDTPKENHLDKWRYNYGQCGHRHPRTKISLRSALKILEAKYVSGKRHWGCKEIAKKLGVSRSQVQRIANGYEWKSDRIFLKALKKFKAIRALAKEDFK